MSNDFELISDLHKDVSGFRPATAFFDAFTAQSVEDQKTQWVALCTELDEREIDKKNAEAFALVTFEARIQGMMTDYNISEGTALRWDMEGAGVDIVQVLECRDEAIMLYLWENFLSFDAMPRFVALANSEFGMLEI